jgi:hypothetical protein
MRRFPHALVLGCLALLALADARAQQASEATVKAAFLYKFPGYVEWGTPPQPGAPFVIGVAGSDEIAEELERLVPSAAGPRRCAGCATSRACAGRKSSSSAARRPTRARSSAPPATRDRSRSPRPSADWSRGA